MNSRKPFTSLLLSRRLTFALGIFLLAFGVRLLSWHDTRLEVGKVQSGVTADYQRIGELLRQGGVRSFFSSSSPLADLNNLGHPPGYPILIALISSVFGNSDTPVQFAQITCDALTAVVIFAIVAEMLSISAAVIAGFLAAFSPQLAWNSVLLLPDSLAVFPILLGISCLALALRKRRMYLFVTAGALIGVSCWFRANGIALTIFLAIVPLILLRNAPGLRFALGIVIGTMLIVLPLTIRNAIVIRQFIPLSLGAGQTLLEGIAEYDPQGRLGIPKTDVGIMKQEAEQFGRPDYYGTLFNPDGVERERARLARGFRVIGSHPFWFAGVMGRRAASMLRLERARLISREPPVSHSFEKLDRGRSTGTIAPTELLEHGTVTSPQASVTVTADGQLLQLNGDNSNYGGQFISALQSVRTNSDYALVIPIKIERGRIRINIVDSRGVVHASTIVETREDKSAQDQPLNQIPLAFVSSADDRLRVAFNNEAPGGRNPVVKIGRIDLYELGPAHFLWTRYPRVIVHAVQKLFITAIILPLALAGIVVLILRRRWPVLPLLLVVPIYYMSVQSMIHTEYRYVLAVNYFLFAFAGFAIGCLANLLLRKLSFPFLWARPGRGYSA
jgi:hypothetical protein